MFGWIRNRLRRGPVVPVVRLTGVIAAGGLMGGRGLSIETTASLLRRAFGQRGARAVALSINSPGGSITAGLAILDTMDRALGAPRGDISPYAPRIITIVINKDKIRDVIGPGGKMIRSIIERTGVKIDVEDDGRVNVASADGASAQKAISIIQELTATPELNKTYLGKIQRITDFGAFVEIMPGTDGLLHVSEIANHRVKDVRDELKEGEQILVKVINIDPTGKIRLSRKALLTDEPAKPAEAAPAFGHQVAFAHGAQFSHQCERVVVFDVDGFAVGDRQGKARALQQTRRVAKIGER